jgi:PIN domain nuclease of toxin-antitoxin system
MRVLIDTHAFLWFIFADSQLSRVAADVIGDPDNEPFLSIASVWEIAIKVRTEKLRLPDPLDRFLREQLRTNRVQLLPIKFAHAVRVHSLAYARLPNGAEHKDPIDRLIASQALIEGVPLVSVEALFAQYGVDVRW